MVGAGVGAGVGLCEGCGTGQAVGNGIGARVGWYDGCCEKDGGFVAYVGASDGLCVGVAVLGSGVA